MPLHNPELIPVFPISFEYFHDEGKVLTGNPILISVVSSYRYNFIGYQEPPAINNSWSFSRLLQAGNYRLFFLCNIGNQFGKLKLEANGSLLFDDLDFYHDGVLLGQVLTKDITIAGNGIIEFKFTVFDKNPVATDYYCSITKIWAVLSG